MTDQTDIEDDYHQLQRSGVSPVTSARQNAEHLLAEGVDSGRIRPREMARVCSGGRSQASAGHRGT